MGVGVPVGVGVQVGEAVGVLVKVGGSGVGEGVQVGVVLGEGVEVMEGDGVAVQVGVTVTIGVEVGDGVLVGVGVGGTAVLVAVAVWVAVGVAVTGDEPARTTNGKYTRQSSPWDMCKAAFGAPLTPFPFFSDSTSFNTSKLATGFGTAGNAGVGTNGVVGIGADGIETRSATPIGSSRATSFCPHIAGSTKFCHTCSSAIWVEGGGWVDEDPVGGRLNPSMPALASLACTIAMPGGKTNPNTKDKTTNKLSTNKRCCDWYFMVILPNNWN